MNPVKHGLLILMEKLSGGGDNVKSPGICVPDGLEVNPVPILQMKFDIRHSPYYNN